MKFLLQFIACFLFYILVSCGRNEIFIAPDNSEITYTGRIDFSDPKRPVFMYSGVTIRAAFKGTSASIILKDDSARNYFNISIDTSEYILKTLIGDSVYQIADNLPNAVHHMEITRITEWHGGNTVFLGLNIKGKGLVPVDPKERKIEFIGNSITCGYGTEGKSHDEHFRYETENCLHTYAAFTAKSLNADFMLVCRSGIGMYQSYGGDKDFAMPLLYEEINSGSTLKWDFNKFIPDLVIIELGANDLSSKVDSISFSVAYLDFLKKLRSYYPSAKIICLSGPGSVTEMDGNRRWINLVSAVTVEASESIGSVYYFNLDPTDHNGSDWHPSSNEHRKISVSLTAYIKTLMNWQ